MLNLSRIFLRRAIVTTFQRKTLSRPRQLMSPKSNYCTEPIPTQKIKLAELEKKMQLIYTCKVCTTRNHHTISKSSYENGVVIVECCGCKNNHLVADNLGWFRDNNTNIEDLMKEKGEVVRKMEKKCEEIK